MYSNSCGVPSRKRNSGGYCVKMKIPRDGLRAVQTGWCECRVADCEWRRMMMMKKKMMQGSAAAVQKIQTNPPVVVLLCVLLYNQERGGKE